jgi:hypothetical protein
MAMEGGIGMVHKVTWEFSCLEDHKGALEREVLRRGFNQGEVWICQSFQTLLEEVEMQREKSNVNLIVSNKLQKLFSKFSGAHMYNNLSAKLLPERKSLSLFNILQSKLMHHALFKILFIPQDSLIILWYQVMNFEFESVPLKI